MTTQVVLLRAVNVGGRGKIAMADLRSCLAELGFDNVRTLLQSGNVVLNAEGLSGAVLENHLEAELLKRLKLRTDILVRSAKQWQELVEANPFPNAARDDPSHLLVMISKKPPTAAGIKALQAAASTAGGGEMVRSAGSQVYITFPSGIGRSRLTGKVIEQCLGTPATGRNWNTVLKLAEMVAGLD